MCRIFSDACVMRNSQFKVDVGDSDNMYIYIYILPIYIDIFGALSTVI